MTYAFTDTGITITTWRKQGDTWVWRARRNADDVVEFTADRDADIEILIKAAVAALDGEAVPLVAE
jgi:hypothetical protein